MSGEWIRMRRGLRHDPKVVAMARHLGARRDFMDWWSDPCRMTCDDHVTEVVTFANVTRVTVCALLDVWASLNQSVDSNDESRVMILSDLDDIAEIPGFGDAMEAVGWVVRIDDDDRNGLRFPNFREYNTPEKDRTQAKSGAERTREYRERKRAEERVTPVTKCDDRREEKREEETKEKGAATPPGRFRGVELPTSLDTPAFVAAWDEWLAYRRETRRPAWKPTTIRKSLESLARDGPAAAVETIRRSIANGWSGLFPDKGKAPEAPTNGLDDLTAWEKAVTFARMWVEAGADKTTAKERRDKLREKADERYPGLREAVEFVGPVDIQDGDQRRFVQPRFLKAYRQRCGK